MLYNGDVGICLGLQVHHFKQATQNQCACANGRRWLPEWWCWSHDGGHMMDETTNRSRRVCLDHTSNGCAFPQCTVHACSLCKLGLQIELVWSPCKELTPGSVANASNWSYQSYRLVLYTPITRYTNPTFRLDADPILEPMNCSSEAQNILGSLKDLEYPREGHWPCYIHVFLYKRRRVILQYSNWLSIMKYVVFWNRTHINILH